MTGYDLSSLRISLLAAREPPEARFELKAAGEDRGTTSVDLTANLADLGFTDLRPSATPPSLYALPSALLERLAARVGELDQKRPLWLDVVHPAGVLAMVPWEQLFQSRLSLPLLRMPTMFVEPAHSRTYLDVALIANDPLESPQRMAELLCKLTERIVKDTPLAVFVHVFTDASTYHALPEADWPSGLRSEVVVYDPADDEEARLESSSASRLELPEPRWLQWVRRAAVHGQIDVVHLVTHSRLLNGSGALALSEGPFDDQRDARVALLNAEGLDRFMTQVGAWSLVLSSPPSGGSGGPQRHLATTMAVLRPGSVLWHDLPADPEAALLGAAFRFLFANEPGEPPRTPHLAMCCQPWQVAAEVLAGPAAQWRSKAHDEEPISDKVRTSLEDRPTTPLWITAAQRYIERVEWKLLRQEQQNLPTQEASELRDALATLQQVIDTYTEAEVPPQPPAPNSRIVGAGPDVPKGHFDTQRDDSTPGGLSP